MLNIDKIINSNRNKFNKTKDNKVNKVNKDNKVNNIGENEDEYEEEKAKQKQKQRELTQKLLICLLIVISTELYLFQSKPKINGKKSLSFKLRGGKNNEEVDTVVSKVGKLGQGISKVGRGVGKVGRGIGKLGRGVGKLGRGVGKGVGNVLSKINLPSSSKRGENYTEPMSSTIRTSTQTKIGMMGIGITGMVVVVFMSLPSMIFIGSFFMCYYTLRKQIPKLFKKTNNVMSK